MPTIFSSLFDHDGGDDNSNGTSSAFLDKHVSVRVVVGVTCCLSMFGALLIILSYGCIRSLRSQGRLILLNLAITDFIVGLSNFIGAVVNFDQYYYNTSADNPISPSEEVDIACKVQAIIAHFSTAASVLWTVCLAVYMYLLVFQNREKNVKRFLPISCIVCYGFPLIQTIWLLCTHRLGHSPYNAAAWCGLIINSNDKVGGGVYIVTTIGYDLWIYLTMFLSLNIYVSIFMYLHLVSTKAQDIIGKINYWKCALQFLDYKLVFVPLAFIILRMWSCILNVLLTYVGIDANDIPKQVSVALIYLSGIGDSGQGFANGLLFVVFAGEVRKKLFSCRKRQGGQINDERTRLIEDDSSSFTASIMTPTATSVDGLNKSE